MKRMLPALANVLAACSSAPPTPSAPPPTPVGTRAPNGDAKPATRRSPYAPAQEDVSTRGNYVAGGLYAPDVKDSAPD